MGFLDRLARAVRSLLPGEAGREARREARDQQRRREREAEREARATQAERERAAGRRQRRRRERAVSAATAVGVRESRADRLSTEDLQKITNQRKSMGGKPSGRSAERIVGEWKNMGLTDPEIDDILY